MYERCYDKYILPDSETGEWHMISEEMLELLTLIRESYAEKNQKHEK